MFRIGAIILYLQNEENEKNSKEKIVRRSLRDSSNPLALPNNGFTKHYRVNKNAFTYLLEMLTNALPKTENSAIIPPIIKLAACLRFFAEGAYQKGIARDYQVAMAQSTFSEVLSEFLNLLEVPFCRQWVAYPTEEENAISAQAFYRKFGFPGVTGCIDGTHVIIIAPKESKHLYRNRKGKFSINVTLICDQEMRIRFIDASHPGGCHDSYVWNMSLFRKEMERKFLEEGGSSMWLLGDAGYPLEPWLMTPYRKAQPDSVETNFNEKHSKCRNIIERTNGVLKNRWRCILGARELYYSPKKAIQIINVCAALHNVYIFYKCTPMPSLLPDYDTEFGEYNFSDESAYLPVAKRIRNSRIANSI